MSSANDPNRAAEVFGIAKHKPTQNWLTADDIQNLLYLADFEGIREFSEVLAPLHVPLVSNVLNRYFAKVWPFRHLDLAYRVAELLRAEN